MMMARTLSGAVARTRMSCTARWSAGWSSNRLAWAPLLHSTIVQAAARTSQDRMRIKCRRLMGVPSEERTLPHRQLSSILCIAVHCRGVHSKSNIQVLRPHLSNSVRLLVARFLVAGRLLRGLQLLDALLQIRRETL